jgi:hypothetical protein
MLSNEVDAKNKHFIGLINEACFTFGLRKCFVVIDAFFNDVEELN